VHTQYLEISLVPRPPPRFYPAAVEIISGQIKSGLRPGKEATWNYQEHFPGTPPQEVKWP